MSVHTFDTAQELMDFLESVRENDLRSLMKSELKPHHLTEGTCFVRFWQDFGETLLIFGEVKRSPYEEDWPFEEDARRNGYIMGRCYSIVCPQGELGSTHVSRINYLISREAFETAKANGWRHTEKTN